MSQFNEPISTDEVVVKIQEYKCFSPEGDEFSVTDPITLIFGPNGSGKTALTRIFGRNFNSGAFTIKGHLSAGGQYSFLNQAQETLLNPYNPEKCFSDLPILQHNLRIAKENLIQHTIHLSGGNETNIIKANHTKPHLVIRHDVGPVEVPLDMPLNLDLTGRDFVLHPTSVFEIASPRRIEPEQARVDIAPNGAGTTSTLLKWQHTSGDKYVGLQSQLIDAFNSIVDEHEQISHYRVVQLPDHQTQDLFTIEFVYTPTAKPTNTVLLQDTGAGFQTILMCVLAMLGEGYKAKSDRYADNESPPWAQNLRNKYPDVNDHLLPACLASPPRQLFVIEEVEAHLHPRTIRRLLDFLLKSLPADSQLVLTSHSPVVLDYMVTQGKVQILNLQKENSSTVIKRISDHQSRYLALSQTGALPSDLCFSNSVIWVEGPSDRLYLQWLIGLYTDLKLIEGYHYSIMWFGGANVSHITFQHRTEELNQKASLIAINPNSYLVIDSDLYGEREQLKDNAKAALTHLESKKQAWVTSGSEFENYLPLEILKLAEPKIKDMEMPKERLPFTPRAESTHEGSVYKNLTGKISLRKVPFAQKVVEEMREKTFKDSEIQALHNSLDFKNQIRSLVEKICEWNNLNADSVWAYREPGSEIASN